MSQTKSEILAKLEPLRDQIYEIERAERRAETAALIGRCFKFDNSYGDDGRWWLYALVTHATEWGHPLSFTFQITSRRAIEIEREHLSLSVGEKGGWVPIPREEFDREWAAVQALIQSLPTPRDNPESSGDSVL